MNEEKINRLKGLVTTLNNYRNAYYNKNNSPISDYEYDKLYDELTSLEKETGVYLSNSPTQSVGYEVLSKLEKIKHSHPMLSLDKTKSAEDLVKFSCGRDCIISLKLDGLTCLITMNNGKLIQAESRGNGEIGELITHNAKVFKNIPLTIQDKDKREFEGEAIITKQDFDIINDNLPAGVEKYKNCRNLASGSVRQLDSSIAKERNISFIVWKIPDGFPTFTAGFEYAKSCGFDVVPYVKYNSNTDDINEKIDYMKKYAEFKGYPIDGLVITYDDVAYGKSLGLTGHHPRHSVAFKFYNEEEVTTLRQIEWSMGKTGDLTPVAIFDTVEIDGTEVSRASVHNVSIMKELQLGIGDEITVIKSNQIIPQLRENLTKSNTAVIPSICPICGAPTEIVQDNDSQVLRCTNDDCRGKLLGKLSHFCSRNAMNIDGMSEATLDFLIKRGWVSKFIDLYRLNKYAADWSRLPGFGKRSVEKLLQAIDNSRNTTLDRFINALSIPLIGKSTAKLIAKSCKDNPETFFNKIDSYGGDAFINVEGVGTETSKSISLYWNAHKDMIRELADMMNFDIPKHKNTRVVITGELKNLIGKTFVITGSLNYFPNRDAAKEEIEAIGGKVAGSVSAKTTYLVNNDVNSMSGKNKKAKELGIPIISEEQLIAMMR